MIEDIFDDCSSKSVSCTNIPEAFLDKNIATKYFSQFGRIHNFILRPKRLACTVVYETAEEAKKALAGGYIYDGVLFNMMYTPKDKPKMDFVDPDVQMELEAMSGRTNKIGDSELSKKPEIKPLMSLMHDTIKRQILRTPKTVDLPSQQKSIPVIDLTQKNEIDLLRQVMMKQAFTVEERYRILDARDKLIRLTKSTTKDLTKSLSTQGVCPDMCPEKERLMREAQHQITLFELEENSKNQMKHEIAIKQYSRSSADQEAPLPHELRPEPVLKMTMNYLLHEVIDLCDSPDISISDWYHFVWDRTRSLRKDITQQELCSQGVVSLVEQCARWHIHCAARLVAEEPQVFDQKINTENLTKCLQTLKYMYHDLRLKNETCPNESEFRAYVILLNLHDSNFMWEVNQLPSRIRQSAELKFAMNVYMAIQNNNYVKFFQLVRRTTYLNACILIRYFVQIRVKALYIMIKAYTARAPASMALSHWTYILGFEDSEQCTQFFEYYGMQCDRDDDRVTLDRNSLYDPDLPFFLDRAINVVEHKRICSIGEVVRGQELESRNDFEKHVPHDSFDENGYLTDLAWTADDQNYFNPPTPKLPQKSSPIVISSSDSEESIFKIPLAPVTKTNQSPKPSIFTKISPKSTAEFKKSETFASELMETSPKSESFGPFAKPQVSFQTSSPQQIFSLGNFGQGSTNTTKNIFTLSSQKDDSSSATKSTESKSIFQIPSWTSPGQQQSETNIFSRSLDSSTATTKSQNIFQIANLPSEVNLPKNIFQTAKSEFNVSGFKSSPAESSKNIFSLQGPIGADSQSKNVFQFPSSSISDAKISTEMESKRKAVFPDSILVSGTIQLNNDKQMIPASGLFSGFLEKSNRTETSADNQKKSTFSSSISGIVPLNPPKSIDTLNIKLEQQKHTDLEREKLRKQKEADELKVKEEEKRKLAELKKEQEQLLLKLKHEKIKKIEIASTAISKEIIEEYLTDEIRKILQIQIKKVSLFNDRCKKIFSEILDETIKEDLTLYINETIAETTEAKRLKNIETTPIWMPDISIMDHVASLQHPSQNFNLNLKHRYQAGSPENIRIPADKEKSIDLFTIIPPEIPRSRFGRKLTRSMFYWKCAISIPDADEDRLFSRVDKWLNNIFLRRSNAAGSNTFFCEQYRHQFAKCGFGICLRKLIGSTLISECGKNEENSTIGLNGAIIFVSTANLKKAQQRLKAILKNPGINDAIGIVLYNSGSVDQEKIRKELNLDQLIRRSDDMDQEPDFFCCDATQSSLGDLLETALKFVASHYSFETLLEMQSTATILSECLGDQFWNRISSSAQHNPGLAKSILDINFLIRLYNHAVTEIIEICSKDFSHHPDFPNEFKQFVPKNCLNIPLEYEYFPSDWKSPNRSKNLIKFLKSLQLKPIQLNTNTLDEIQQSLLEYCSNLIPSCAVSERAAYRMIESLLKYLQSENEFDVLKDNISTFSWIEPIKLLTLEILSFRYDEARAWLPSEIIYNKDDLKKYTSTFWWLRKNGLLKNVRISDENWPNEKCSPEAIKKPRICHIDSKELDDILAKGAASLKKAEHQIEKYKTITGSSKELTRELDTLLYIHEQTNRKIQREYQMSLKD